MSRYYPVGVCGCHDCTCPGCFRCEPDDIALGPCDACLVGEHADCDNGRIACPCAIAGHE